MTARDRIIGAVFVIVVVAAQSHWMGSAIALLSIGLIVAYLVWVLCRWKNDPAAVLPVYLLAIAVQCLHFAEEFLTGFARQFPRLLGSTWSDTQFVMFNMAWLAMFVLAALGAYRRMALSYLVVLFLALIGDVANGLSHLLLSAMEGRYFPGAVTAPLCLVMGIVLLTKIFGKERSQQG
jgi:Protein of unknown function with HXXEE motif